MGNKSLYLKYRPKDFANLVGQEYAKKTLINAVKMGKIAHAYLFTGPRGTGKTSSARLMAKALNCLDLQDGYDPCNKCEICEAINNGSLIDLFEIDAASNRGIDEVRDLKEKINFAPSRARTKVYIIDEVHMMTKEAFNALLKTLEEPPDHSYFILATTEVHKIPETIISRCQRFDFRRVSKDDLVARLDFVAQEEGIAMEDGVSAMIARYVNGGMRDALSLLEQLNQGGKISAQDAKLVLGVSDLSLLENLLNALKLGRVDMALKIVNEVYQQGSDLRQFCHDFVDLLRGKMLGAIEEANHVEVRKFIKWIELFQAAQETTGLSIPQLGLEMAVFKAIDKPEAAASVVTVQKTETQIPTKVEPVAVVEQKKVEVAVEKAPEPEAKVIEPARISEAQAPEFNAIREKWSELVESISKPTLRMSLKNSRPSGLTGNDLSLEFGSNFHKSQLEDHENCVKLEDAIKNILGMGVKITTHLNEAGFEPAPVVHKAAPEEGLNEIDGNSKNEEALDAALDIFGGEVIS